MSNANPLNAAGRRRAWMRDIYPHRMCGAKRINQRHGRRVNAVNPLNAAGRRRAWMRVIYPHRMCGAKRIGKL
ncbi:MAG: hypothetical protein LBH05_08540 [Deferribacteraceae bacterium]|nr:hypothetical protein [Deferribacteraceae bacterium]